MSLQFDSRENYMKKRIIKSTTMNGPNVVSAYTTTYQRTLAIPHGEVGRIPYCRVYYEPFRDGRITNAYEDSQDWLSDPPNNYGGSASAPICCYWVDETNLYVMLRYTTNALSATAFPIHYIIYRDYGLA